MNFRLFYLEPMAMRPPFPPYKVLKYNPQIVQDSIQSVLFRFCANQGEGHYEDYVWSLYDTLGIPENSFIDATSMIELIQFLVRSENPLQCPLIPTRFWSISTPFLFISDERAKILQIARGDGTTLLRQHELHVEDDGTIAPMQDLYKLHVCVKHKYILYTVLKLMAFRATIQDIRPFQMKCLLNSRYSEISEQDTLFLDLAGNGGSVPPIVLYMNQNPDVLHRIFQGANALFSESDRQVMGLLTSEHSLRIPPLNVRLNEMFAYALGDRDQKLTRYETDVREGKEPTCKLPQWLLKSLESCSNINTRESLQTQFGRPLCEQVKNGNFQKRNRKGNPNILCYLTLSEKEMVSPNTLLSTRGGKRRRNRTKRCLKKRSTYKRAKDSATT